MVQELPRTRSQGPFPEAAPAAFPVFYRTYSRRGEVVEGQRETWDQVCDRTLAGLIELGNLTDEEAALLNRMQRQVKALPSGRWLWVGGTDWSKQPENFSGAYNCTSTDVVDWRAFGLMMDLAMMGCGTGAILEPKYINQIPVIRNRLIVTMAGDIGETPVADRREVTDVAIEGNQVAIRVGDSRQGWVKSYETLLELSTDERFTGEVQVTIDLRDVRPAGEKLKGFGGVANPVRLSLLYDRCASILNKALGRQLSSVECCLLIDEAAACVVAGNIRRSAGMRQFDSNDELAASAKDNLWQQDAEGNWRIDPERDVLRMANHTRVFHTKPSLQDCIDSVRKQFYSGEGAIQWAGEAKKRAGGDDRYGLNPCVTADTWVHTGDGPRQVKDLIGQQHSTYVNGELFSTTPEGFFYSGTKSVLKLVTQEGQTLRLTGNHRVLKVTAQTQKAQYTEWVAADTLQPGDRVMLHNHRDLQPWDGPGNAESGWLLGNLVGDGSLAETQWNDAALLRFWGDSQEEMSEHAIALLTTNVGYERRTASAHYHTQLKHRVVNSAGLARLAAKFGIAPRQKAVTTAIEQGSYEFYRGFLRGLFDADGSVQGHQTKGVSVRLAQSNLTNLEAVQRMLGRLGIVATIDQERRPEGHRLLPDTNREPASYFCQSQHELVIANDNLQVFESLVGFREPFKSARLTDLLANYKRRPNRERFTATVATIVPDGVEAVYDCTVPGPNRFDANGFVAHNCGEILGANFHCNLAEVHLNQLDPTNLKDQEDAFTAAALSVAVLLNHQFNEPRYQKSRLEDPIVGVSFTGLFDFFVIAFGVEWLRWWEAGRPNTMQGLDFKAREEEFLTRWKDIVHRVVGEYCDRHNLVRPNRCTTVQPAGTKSLLTGASPGWHPPKAQRFIRRITFRKNDPVAMACIDYGYSIVPSQSDKDENGGLLDDPFDPRCTEWLVEIPVEVLWANLPGADEIAIEKFSAAAQFDFYMQVQKHYTTHNTSATIEFREPELEDLAERIYQTIQNDEGYISAALLARFDDLQTFPRLPFEPIDKATFEALKQQVEARRGTENFHSALSRYDAGELIEAGPAGCDSDKCMMPEKKPD
ncbi:ribonucleoside-triphosphate reductase, adenosylcobalamin-dependent [Phormidium tenue]|uniref:Ribonucleoside-triphosphate reductase, adenosylcobalamin-dependent n=1 Tax=Phormidium tenue NIES-30 TaxID=549789 RepID=A0A1U7JAA1_9CYAN|nr:ribonucleoside-triphosphate reductase, adenosylcobalamin-dependent [Phormidium tenue]MBD2230513.1 ribonucleoside-triphosphate reductase, adenosylcobalamin-dependent [Phormidium tenue FACHB-1052]OKH50708.1 ribonucleoside-triphosphate reductase, adenosylcobalamin-dependent [Phormidium tenue NIES-30]